MISVVDSKSNDGNSQTPSVLLPSASVGDLLLVYISFNYASGDPAINDNNGGTPLTKDKVVHTMGGGNSVTCFSRKITGSEPSTLNFVTASAAQRWDVLAAVISGWDGTTVYDVNINSFDNFSAPKSSLTCASVNTNIGGALALAIATIDGASNGTFNTPFSPSGWTDLIKDNNQQPLAISYKVIPSIGATGTCDIGCNLTGGFASALNIFSIKPLVSSTGTHIFGDEGLIA